MSVLPCSREGCENIMCDYYSHKYGYLCYECMDELRYRPQDIDEFMATPRGASSRMEEHIAMVENEFEPR